MRIRATSITAILASFWLQLGWAETSTKPIGAVAASGVAESAPGPSKLYSKDDFVGLTTCAGHSATAATIASWKRDGLSQERITDYYNKNVPAERLSLTLSIVEKVFAESSGPAVPYAISFFSQCAKNIAEVPEDKIFASRVCFVHMLTASNASKLKISGSDKASAYAKLSYPEAAATLIPVIDRAFSSAKKSSFEIGLDEWVFCMKEFS